MQPSDIPRYAAQIAAGSGDSNDIFSGDAGALHYHDVAWAPSGHAAAANGVAPSPSKSSGGRTPSKLRKSIADAGGASRPADGGAVLRADVLDALSQFLTLQEDMSSRANSVAERCGEANVSIAEHLKKFDDNFLYKNRVGFTVQRLNDEARVEIDLPFQRRFGPLTIPQVEAYQSVLTELSAGRVDNDEVYRGRIQRNVTQPLFPLGDGGIPQLLLSVNAFALTDVLADTTAKLAAAAKLTDALTAQIDELRAELRVAMAREELARADELEQRLQTLCLERFEIHRDRVKLVGAGDASVGVSAKLEEVMHAPQLPVLTAEKEQLKKQILSDISILEKDRVSRNQHNASKIAHYNAFTQRNAEQLEKNFYQQRLVWDEIRDKVDRLGELGEAAKALADHRIETTEVEQKRRTEFAEYKESFATQRQYEAELLESTSTALDFIEGVREFLEVGQNKVTDMQVEARLADMVAAERSQMEEAFTAAGELVVRRYHTSTVRATNTDRLVHESQHQLHDAANTDDTDHADVQHRLTELDSRLNEHRDRETYQRELLDGLTEKYNVSAAHVEDDRDAADESPLVKLLATHAELRDAYEGQRGGLLTDFAVETDRFKADVEAKQGAIADLEVRRDEKRRLKEERQLRIEGMKDE